MLAIRLPEDIENRLSHLAQETGRTKTYYAREAILKHLSNLEDYYLAESVSQKVKNGEMMTYSVNEVRKELGLDD